jgi:hypothetical protein
MASIRETSPADPRRIQPASGTLSAEPQTPPVGSVVAARVVAGETGADLLLELAGQRVRLADSPGHRPGGVVAMRVERGSDGLKLVAVTGDDAVQLSPALVQALREALPRQTSLAVLLPLLARLGGDRVPAATRPPADTPEPELVGRARPGAGPAAPTAPAASPAAAGATPTTPPGDGRSGAAPAPAAATATATAAAAAAATAAWMTGTGSAATGPEERLPSLESLLGGARSRTGLGATGETPALPAFAIAAHVDALEGTRSSLRPPPGDAESAGTPISRSGADPGRRVEGEGAAATPDQRLARSAELLPPGVTAALRALAGRLPTLTDLCAAAGLARVVENAGLMLEARLARAPAPARAELAADLKAGLLGVRAAIEATGRADLEPTPAPSAGAVTAGGATEADRSTPVKLLAEMVDGALARIGVNQLQAAGLGEGMPLAFSCEIPLRGEDGRFRPLCFEFEREPADPARPERVTASVTLHIEPPGLGPMAAVLRLGGDHISAELWAEAPETRALLHAARDLLAARLKAAGLEVTAISLTQEPPARPQGWSGQSSPLIEATV